MTAKIKATIVAARELQPGDLFSTRGPDYWDSALDTHGIGEAVYVRKPADLDPAADDTLVYRIEIEREQERENGTQYTDQTTGTRR